MLPDATLTYRQDFLAPGKAMHLLDSLKATLQWRQDHIRLFGRLVKIPRLQAWYGDPDTNYVYSGLELQPMPWTNELLNIKAACEQVCQTRFNSVLANWYRDGQDSMGWHSDNEPELGVNPVIASVSLGEIRNLDFRHKVTGQKLRLPLASGSLLIMAGTTQLYWQHGIAKSRKPMGERINLTFRTIRGITRQN